LLKAAYSFSRSFSTDTHREKTSVRRKANKCVVIYSVGYNCKNKGCFEQRIHARATWDCRQILFVGTGSGSKF